MGRNRPQLGEKPCTGSHTREGSRLLLREAYEKEPQSVWDAWISVSSAPEEGVLQEMAAGQEVSWQVTLKPREEPLRSQPPGPERVPQESGRVAEQL